MLWIFALGMSSFQIYTALFGTFPSISQRAIHLAFAMVLAWLLFGPKTSDGRLHWTSWILIAVTVLDGAYLATNGLDLLARMSYFDPLSILQMTVGISLVAMLVECSRRTVGKAFTIILLVLLLYAYFGSYFSGNLYHSGFTVMWITDHLVFTTNGIFGMPSGVSATYIFMFLLFGAFIERTGAGQFLMDLAVSMAGRYRGGPAKVAVVGSGLFGMISGSAVANVVTTGAMTIPLMKRLGFKPTFAAGVEAVASSGGQFTPPLMGATAFLVAEFAGLSYLYVAAAAAIPAALYFMAVIWQVHFRALKDGLEGMPERDMRPVRDIMRTGWFYVVSIVVLLGMLLVGYTPMRSGLVATTVLVAIGSIVKLLRRDDWREILMMIADGLRNAAIVAVQVAIILNAAGIVIGLVQMTGLGLRFSSIILDLGGQNLGMILFLIMITSILLGMGLPTVGAYIIQVSLTVPVLTQLDIAPLASHMFVFYFATLSAITPPVAVAAYAAAAIAGAGPMATGMIALRLAIAGFIVPFMFVIDPALLLQGDWHHVLIAVVTGSIGVYLLAAAVEGWMLIRSNIPESCLLFVAAILLLLPGLVSDLTASVAVIIVYVSQTYRRGRGVSLD
ncbi:TRAP transporter permease [Roseovarius sp.]|uniref:TRAP transporter permease n=1 Tax=Roseovarius sp. TaxID=1486281 RepID=UPI00356AAA10